MKVAVLGGTGKMGRGLAKHLSRKNEVIIGSRDSTKAEAAAKDIPGAKGGDYSTASSEADAVVLAIPYEALPEVLGLVKEVSGKLVISAINPMKMDSGMFVPACDGGSAAEELAKLLPGSRVATAFNNVSATFLQREEFPLVDVLIASDTRETYEEAAGLVRTIQNMRPLYAGPLSQAGTIERITPLELNVAKLNGTGSLGPRFVSRKD
jgi:8-hydroxy-5-deazaflavin:NADPH oxidoreductase